jgi:hypothetical protein
MSWNRRCAVDLTRVGEADSHYQPCLLQSVILVPLRVFRQAGWDRSVT